MKVSSRLKKLVPKGQTFDKADDQIARWGRSRHDGFKIGKFLQAPPLLFTQDHHPLWMADKYRGSTAFLILGGPSFKEYDHSLLRKPGLLTMGVNNSVRSFRPNLWTSVDSPCHFIKSVWLDPKIEKFVPICHANKQIFDSDAWKYLDIKVGDCPNVVYYKRNEKFQARQFLWEDCFNWGNHKKHGGGRSIMLVAIRLLFYLGVRRVYLLGADFKMDESVKYHFDQDRHKGSINGNNSTYKKMNNWFRELRPLFERENFHVYNCYKDSGLTAFEHVPFKDAIAETLSNDFMNIDVDKERTKGLYDTDKKQKEKGEGK